MALATYYSSLPGMRIETLCLRPSCFVLLSPQFDGKSVDETEEDDVVSSGVYELVWVTKTEPLRELVWESRKDPDHERQEIHD